VTEAILRVWARTISREITTRLEETAQQGGSPVVVLRGLAALHLVLLIPGIRPPQTSRRYLFLGQERLRFDFYRGEEM
jgi:hypothetical protein